MNVNKWCLVSGLEQLLHATRGCRPPRRDGAAEGLLPRLILSLCLLAIAIFFSPPISKSPSMTGRPPPPQQGLPVASTLSWWLEAPPTLSMGTRLCWLVLSQWPRAAVARGKGALATRTRRHSLRAF